MSLPKTNWPRILALVVCYVERTSKAAAARIPINGSVSSTYVSCRLYVHIRFPNTLCIFFLVTLACGFLGEHYFY